MDVYSYSFRASRFGQERRFTLSPEGLSWDGSQTPLAYKDVGVVKVYKTRFLGSSRTYWTCILKSKAGESIYLSAAHRLTFRKVQDRTASYIPFIKELEARTKAASSSLCFIEVRSPLARIEAIVGVAIVRLFRSLRYLNRARVCNAAGAVMRFVGPRLRGHRAARSHLVSAFPQKSADEIDCVLKGMWDNIGRVAAEYAFLDQVWDFDLGRPDRQNFVTVQPDVVERCRKLSRADGPALMFSAHLGNWEIPALAARALGRDIVLVFRQPKTGPFADELKNIRQHGVAGVIAAGADAPLKIRAALQRGVLVGMLVDQYDARGVDVDFFGRPSRVGGTLARMARLFECPVYGSRVIRRANGGYEFEMTDPLSLPRDAEGKIDVEASMQMVTSIIEGWIREHPDQWIWTHRHWRQ